ncbi:MAG: hypothetical protein C0473_01230 [Cyanobacteria bacterium DS3.002]|nr:hypothetical protein [Cyanobacteria bacterium DS3.002]
MSNLTLAEIIEEPEFHQLLLADYGGPYSLGVIDKQKILISLPDTPSASSINSKELDFKGLHILVEVRHDWAQPRKLA